MWTFIKKENVESYIHEYPELEEHFINLILTDTKDVYFLPRLMSVNYPSTHLVNYNGSEKHEYEKIDIKFTSKLRENQVPMVGTVLDLYKKNGYVNGIIKAFPGAGKTVIAAYIAAQMGLKTLIVVDNSQLMKQWIRTFVDFTNLTVNDIGIIQQKSFGVDRMVVIAMAQTVQSYLKKGVSEAFNIFDKAGFGLVFYDEVHTTSSANVFSKISLLFRTRNILGLSATPFNNGAAEILMHNTVGEVIYETKEYDTKPEYKLLYYKSNLDAKKIFVINKLQEYLHRKSIINKLIIDSENYKNLILNQTRKMRALGHRVIIVCFTKAQVTTISEVLSNNDLKNTKFYGDEREITYTENILIVTYSFCGKGFDFKELSCLILACSLAGKKSLIQVIGRILRKDENKLPPIVIDLIDMSIPMISLPEAKIKKNIVSNEFACVITEETIS